jgi:hypothetical protein
MIGERRVLGVLSEIVVVQPSPEEEDLPDFLLLDRFQNQLVVGVNGVVIRKAVYAK